MIWLWCRGPFRVGRHWRNIPHWLCPRSESREKELQHRVSRVSPKHGGGCNGPSQVYSPSKASYCKWLS
jgi:hypothetical protein